MADLPAALPFPSWVHDLNLVDAALLLFFAVYAVYGVRRGFIAGALVVLGVFVTLALAIKGYRPAGDLIQRFVPLPPVGANAAGFLGVLLVGQLVFTLVVRTGRAALRPVRRLLAPLRVVDHALGFIPGLIQAAALAALVLAPLRLIQFSRPLAAALDDSIIAAEIAHRVSAVTPLLGALFGREIEDALVLRSQVANPEARVRVPQQAQLTPDPAAEARMLELVNAERRKAGLRPLAADDRIRDVARGHSEEMFRLGYFSHTSPQLGSPANRLRQAGVPFVAAGENLAYAPTVELAHSGLMTSPGHRRNILAPEYSRIGIGVVSAGLYGRMFTQNFAN